MQLWPQLKLQALAVRVVSLVWTGVAQVLTPAIEAYLVSFTLLLMSLPRRHLASWQVHRSIV
jgi:hypothetical protein